MNSRPADYESAALPLRYPASFQKLVLDMGLKRKTMEAAELFALRIPSSGARPVRRPRPIAHRAQHPTSRFALLLATPAAPAQPVVHRRRIQASEWLAATRRLAKPIGALHHGLTDRGRVRVDGDLLLSPLMLQRRPRVDLTEPPARRDQLEKLLRLTRPRRTNGVLAVRLGSHILEEVAQAAREELRDHARLHAGRTTERLSPAL